MGTLIPNNLDQQIRAKLNLLFETFLKDFAGHTDQDGHPIFHASKHDKLHRIARRIGAYPDPTDDAGRNPRARWYVFLKGLKNKHDRAGSAENTAEAICNVIRSAMNAGADRILFDVKPVPTSLTPKTVYVLPNNHTPGEVDGKTYKLTLAVEEEMNVGAYPVSHAQDGNDGHERHFGFADKLPWPPDNADYAHKTPFIPTDRR